ncbi:tail fiber assembly protein [Morganella morganii]
METTILSQKFFIAPNGSVNCIDIMELNKDTWKDEVGNGFTEISKNEADKIMNPPPTKEQLVDQAEAQKQHLITEVNAETQLLQTKLALGRIKPDEKALLNAWLDYLDKLEAVDVSTAPDIIWPVKP